MGRFSENTVFFELVVIPDHKFSFTYDRTYIMTSYFSDEISMNIRSRNRLVKRSY